MGQVFQRAYRAKDGSLRTCETWTIRYYRSGKPHQEPTKFVRKTDADRLLKTREGDIAKGVPVTAANLKLTFDDAAKDVVNDFIANRKRSLKVVERRIRKHLKPFFGGRRLSEITPTDVRAFVAQRQTETISVRKARQWYDADGKVHTQPEVRKPVSNAEINRELQILKRCFSLAVQSGKLMMRPHVPMLEESPARSGFFEPDQIAAVRSHLPAALQPIAQFAYVTGWRVPSEVLPLEWRQVDFAAGEVRLDPGTTKNRDGRVFKMTRDLRAMLTAQRAVADQAQRECDRIIPWVFFRMVAEKRDGKKKPRRVLSLTKAWKNACREAGCPGRIPHDLRRTSVRNLVRAGVPERVAMTLTGHKTRSVFERYNIVSETDLTDAAAKLDAYDDRDSSVTVARKPARTRKLNRRIS